jgi:MinD-like ATPase involved in chromosome partitioning or flagellar assembly
MTRIIALHAFRHGTGKSNLAAHLAINLAQRGQIVGIIDTHISNPPIPNSPPAQAPGLGRFFGIEVESSTPTLADYLRQETSIEKITIEVSHKIRTAHPSHQSQPCYYVPYPLEQPKQGQPKQGQPKQGQPKQGQPRNDTSGYDPIALDLLSGALTELTAVLDLDYLFLDLYPGLSEATLLPLALVDALILSLYPEPADFQGTAVILDIVQQLELPLVTLAINQAIPYPNVELLQQQLEATYEIPVLGILPFFEDMNLATGPSFFALQQPKHPFGQAIAAMAKTLQEMMAEIELEPIPPPDPIPERSKPSADLTMLDVLALPDEPRQLMNWMIRQGPVQLEEAVRWTQKDAQVLSQVLEDLIQKGFVEKMQREGQVYYQPQLTSKVLRLKSKLAQNIWDSIGD